ncbi:Fe-S cluster assembly ATPase SufC [Candidatus Peregrinibacteria bacterium]|jgi:Fe-S cluster assembly ATP-binding protein|nr:Fe-S cluster assembly ATPase SufC [Candidatus Peregrinibacteria bacterium]MBT7736622.1 Fe-S cluster assembly ATPase SufC [Candidatus Peregrinibacteria bacterium]
MLEIKNLHAKIGDKEILKGLSLNIKAGEIHTIMGPNGSGKSTLCNVLMGHPKFEVTKGSAKLDGKKLLELDTNERANEGLFLAFQQPLEIPGVTFGNFLRLAKNANLKAKDKDSTPIGPVDFMEEMRASTKLLKMDEKFIGRSVNQGFSGGEKKRAEIVQMATLEPKYALLDEIDSGLDIDALKSVAKGIKAIHKKTNPGILIITHYQRILNYIDPDHVHIMVDGKILKSGGPKLAHDLEKNGYEKYIK